MQSQLAYTRDFEREADPQRPHDPAGGRLRRTRHAGLLRAPAANSRLCMRTTRRAYLRTHPLTTDRITDMENRVQGLGYRQVPDSLEFRLVQAKLLALQGSAAGRCAGSKRA